MTMVSRLAAAVLILAAIPAQSVAQARIAPSQSWTGTWRLNLEQSMFSGAPPKSENRTIAIQGRSMVTRSSGESADGKPIHFNYAVKLDGKFHPLIGNPDGNGISIQLISPEKVEIEVRRDGRRSATAIAEVRGSRLTMERHRLPLSGSPSDDILVYDRVR